MAQAELRLPDAFPDTHLGLVVHGGQLETLAGELLGGGLEERADLVAARTGAALLDAEGIERNAVRLRGHDQIIG